MSFIPEPLVFGIALLETGGVLFLLIYFVITLSDLECDYLNAQQCCSRLNTWVVPKMTAHILIVLFLLLHAEWILVIVNLPMGLWIVYDYISVPNGNLGVYDPTEIHNRGQLKKHMRDCMINLGYYLLFFFIYLYCLIVSLLKGDPISRNGYEELMEFDR